MNLRNIPTLSFNWVFSAITRRTDKNVYCTQILDFSSAQIIKRDVELMINEIKEIKLFKSKDDVTDIFSVLNMSTEYLDNFTQLILK